MRAVASIVFSLCAALAVAQNSTNPNAFNVPPAGYNVAAGNSVNLQWSNPQGSTVTIKLQSSGNITPNSGVVLAQSIQNTGSTTVTIPSGANIPAGAYTFEIIDDSNSNDMNFSPVFSVSGASGTGSFAPSTATSTGSSASSSSTGSSSASTTSSSSAAATSSSSSASASSTSSSAAATSTTAVPHTNAGIKAQAPLAGAIMLGAAALL